MTLAGQGQFPMQIGEKTSMRTDEYRDIELR